MADWLKFDSNLPEKPETLAITVEMGWSDRDTTVGKLMRVFRWFDQHTVDGNARNVTPALLDQIIGVSGFVQAMANAGWIVVSDGGLSLQNFGRHNGSTAKNRVLTAIRVAAYRSQNADSKGDDRSSDVCNDSNVTSSLAREDKRRSKTSPEGDVSESVATGSAQVPECPHQEIIELYHQALPTGRQIRVWSAQRRKSLQARWREKRVRQSLDWWRKFFEYCAESEFLTGRAPVRGDRDPFVASLDWLVKAENFAKVIEGKYHKEAA